MYIQLVLLALATAIWGLTFPSGKVAVGDFTPLWLNAIRYLIAALASLPFCLKEKSFSKPWSELKKPIFAGFLLFLALYTQTMGLKYTTVAKSSFITCLYVFMVPLFIAFGGKRFRKRFWSLVGLALLGVAMLCELKMENFNFGDFLTFLCVIACSLHIIFLDKVAKTWKSAFEFNGIQCLTLGALALVLALIFDGPTDFSPLWREGSLTHFSTFWAIFILAIPAGMVAFAIQVHTQKTLSPHVASFIFLMESPFAVLFGYLLIGEKLSALALGGCILITLSVAFVSFLEHLEMRRQAKRKLPAQN